LSAGYPVNLSARTKRETQETGGPVTLRCEVRNCSLAPVPFSSLTHNTRLPAATAFCGPTRLNQQTAASFFRLEGRPLDGLLELESKMFPLSGAPPRSGKVLRRLEIVRTLPLSAVYVFAAHSRMFAATAPRSTAPLPFWNKYSRGQTHSHTLTTQVCSARHYDDSVSVSRI